MNSFFLNPIDEIEVKNIVLSLNSLETTGPNSIPINVSNYQLMFHLNSLSYLAFLFPMMPSN